MGMRRVLVVCLGGCLALSAACSGGLTPLVSCTEPGEGTFPALRVEIGQAAEEVLPFRMTGGPFRAAVVLGHAVPEAHGWKLRLERLDWFNNWPNGWTEASFLLDGRAELLRTETGWLFVPVEAPALDAVDSAAIRYFDTYVRGGEGRREFIRRWDRIWAVVEDVSLRCGGAPELRTLAGLRKWLFPEVYGQTLKAGSARGKSADGIRWDTEYTKKNFAEPLRPLRDSGTMLRDFKESPELWMLALDWAPFWKNAGMALTENL